MRDPRGERCGDRRQSHPDPDAPGRERPDEEIIPLTYLMLEPGTRIGLRIPPLEVQIEDERHAERTHQRSHRERRAAVGLPVPPGTGDAEASEQHRESTLDAPGPVPPDLPGEVLPVVEQLLADQAQRAPGIRLAGGIHRIVEHGRLAELRSHQHGPEVRPHPRVTLIEVWIEMSANRDEHVDAQADDCNECGCRQQSRPS